MKNAGITLTPWLPTPSSCNEERPGITLLFAGFIENLFFI